MTDETNNQPTQKKSASLNEILEAVSQKEAVLKPFSGKKKPAAETPGTGKKLIISFTQGLLFGLGFVLIVGIGLFVILKLNQLHKANLIFYKLMYVLKALGK
jgi:hypothetical protein